MTREISPECGLAGFLWVPTSALRRARIALCPLLAAVDAQRYCHSGAYVSGYFRLLLSQGPAVSKVVVAVVQLSLVVSPPRLPDRVRLGPRPLKLGHRVSSRGVRRSHKARFAENFWNTSVV